MDDIMLQRYRPGLGGIVDTRGTTPAAPNGFYAREYSAVETMDTVRWLNERAAGYPTLVCGAVKQ